MHPWRHHRPSRGKCALLPAFPWHRRGFRARAASARLCQRMSGSHEMPPGSRLLAGLGAGLAARNFRSGRRRGNADCGSRQALGGSWMSTSANTAIQPQTVAQVDFDVYKVRADFPILARQIHGKPLVYLDNAATTQKPQAVIDSMIRYYTSENSNIHRGVHTLSELATESYEQARATVQRFLNAAESREIVFVRGATEGINLVAQTWGRANIGRGDEIVLSAMEHHSNIVPWQILCEQQAANLRIAPVNDLGELLFDEFEKLLGPKTKLVAMAHVSYTLGTVNPVRRIAQPVRRVNAYVLLDGAQAVPHMPIDVRVIDCDFYAFSGHKIYAPTGIGILYGKAELLEAMPPYQGGGDMISSVTFEKTLYNPLPYKFEAGTPHVSGAIGLRAAPAYLNPIGIDRIARHEKQVLARGAKPL